MANGEGAVDAEPGEIKSCTIKTLPSDKWVSAAARAVEHNPANAPMVQMLHQEVAGGILSPSHLTLLTGKYWGSAGVRLTVSFLDGPPADLRARIVSHMNAWRVYANVEFVEEASGGQVRVARKVDDGHWSYLGTDILSVPNSEPTMNLDSFTMDTQDSEIYRVVRHETDHTLGFPHEHTASGILSRINREKAITYFMATAKWTGEMVIQQVLTPQDNSALIATAAPDPLSIMCYFLPASIMEDHIAVRGGSDINVTDRKFASSVYPKFAGWQLLDNNSATVSTIVDDTNLYQLHNTGKIWRYTGPPLTGWQELDDNTATTKIVAARGNLYQLHNTGKLWKYTGVPHTGWQMLDTNAATVDLAASGDDLYQLHNSGRIRKYTGVPLTGWQELDNNAATKTIVASGGNLYQLHKTGLIWKYTGVPYTGWQKLDENAATVEIVARGDELYQLHNAGKIWKYTGIPVTGWQLLDNNPATKEIAVGAGGLYQIHTTGAIWKYVGPPVAGWTQLDGNDASTHIVAGNWLYQLHRTGLIWRHIG
ncbi:hypothetical protein LTR84_002288 [Exophiala bonariae]|uniref:Peptidase metallopeptidase domain-containing protein n=1 Tax=Exophiala bonariae TaxID=1690606 RepID=A0AAV9NDH8_9EURO|nr:hypothetical protein LTR84_002288 [Exophiala bonariae]